jgi:hypothetical protein
VKGDHARGGPGRVVRLHKDGESIQFASRGARRIVIRMKKKKYICWLRFQFLVNLRKRGIIRSPSIEPRNRPMFFE